MISQCINDNRTVKCTNGLPTVHFMKNREFQSGIFYRAGRRFLKVFGDVKINMAEAHRERTTTKCDRQEKHPDVIKPSFYF